MKLRGKLLTTMLFLCMAAILLVGFSGTRQVRAAEDDEVVKDGVIYGPIYLLDVGYTGYGVRGYTKDVKSNVTILSKVDGHTVDIINGTGAGQYGSGGAFQGCSTLT